MSSPGRSPMKGGICHVRGFESLNYLKPYWLTIIILITRRPLSQVSDCISLLRLTWILSGSFFVASYYIIRLKNIFYQLLSNFLNFFYTWRNWDDFVYIHVRAYILKLPNLSNFTWGWISELLGFSFYIFI